MGLDINIGVDNTNEIFTPDYYDRSNDYFKAHKLSRTFCNFMCRRGVVSGEPELDQIGKITAIDISPIYQMESYRDGDELNFLLEIAKSDEERKKILEQIKQSRENLKGNIDKVLPTINSLINKLSSIDNLSQILNDNGFSTLDYKHYFSDFNIDRGQGDTDNNFGQDLRNFKRFLEFAKDKGTTTVYFNYS